ncbi:MAG: hypothetical protein KF764_05645 [Labilithrix sp.]|nr:hypothetical protein [Labilithrix sp.]
MVLAALAGAFAACTDDSDESGAPTDAGTFDAPLSDGTSGDADVSDAATDDASDASDAGDASEAGKPGKLVITSPATVVDEDGGNPVTVPAPNGDVEVIGSTPAGRLVLKEPGTLGAIVSVWPDGTGRVVLADAAGSPNDTTVIRVVAIAPNDTIYYVLTRGAADDYHLGSIKSDGTNRATTVQLTGGATGATNLAFHGQVPGSGQSLFARYRTRIFTTDSRLVFSEYNGGAIVRARAISPDLATATTVFTATPNRYQTVCGVTPDGRAIYYRARVPNGSVFDAVSVKLDGTSESVLTANVTTMYSCEVTLSGHVLVRLDTGNNQRDIHIATGGNLVALRADASVDEGFFAETNDGRLLVHATNQATGATSLHVVNADGTGALPLVTTSDPAGAFGGFLGVTPTGRVIFERSPNFQSVGSLHSIKLDGTGRLNLLPVGRCRSYEPFSVTSSGHFVYRGTGVVSPNPLRLYNMRVDAVVSDNVPDQVMITNDPTTMLSLMLN